MLGVGGVSSSCRNSHVRKSCSGAGACIQCIFGEDPKGMGKCHLKETLIMSPPSSAPRKLVNPDHGVGALPGFLVAGVCSLHCFRNVVVCYVTSEVLVS